MIPAGESVASYSALSPADIVRGVGEAAARETKTHTTRRARQSEQFGCRPV